MPRKIPNCAWCGKKLINRITLIYADLDGKPEIGWCWACANEDHKWAVLGKQERPKLDKNQLYAHLKEIEARGGGRLVANKAWREKFVAMPINDEKHK